MVIRGTKKLTPSDWDAIIDRFYNSGLSCAAFAALEEIPRSCLRYRLQLAKSTHKSSPCASFASFVEVPHPLAPISPPPPPAVSTLQASASPVAPANQAPVCALRLHVGTLYLEFSALPAPDYVLSLVRGLSC